MKSRGSLLRWTAGKLAVFFAKNPKLFFVAVIVYLFSPIDLAPEAILGPLGFVDDFLVLLLPFIIREYAGKLGLIKPPFKRPKDYHDTTAR